MKKKNIFLRLLNLHMSWWSGFTLIELIVVIVILAILSTIGFLSIGGYSSRSRDSQRISDIAQISKSLDISIISASNYPTPDNSFLVSYSGGTVWTQGTLGNTAITYLHNTISGGGLNTKPIDPLKKTEYIYSSLAYGKAYQLKTEYEGDLLATDTDFMQFTTAYSAPGIPTIAYIRGNYGGISAKTITGSTIYVLAVPSIITSSGSIGQLLSIENNDLSGALLFHGKILKQASTFNPNFVAYTGTGLPNSETTIIGLMQNLKSAYSSTSDLSWNQNISALLNTNGTGNLINLGNSILTTQLGGTFNGNSSNENTNNTTCSAGSYSASGNMPCTTTSAGYYTSTASATTQSQCTAGYYCPAGSTSATQNICPVGSYCPTGTGSPSACAWGYTSTAGSTSAVACVAINAGGHIYSTPWIYTWVAPSGVTTVNIVCIGAGGMGWNNNPIAGGGGGALAYTNSIVVVPGNSYTVTVGAVATYGSAAASGNSSFASACIAGGGNNGNSNSLGGNVIAGTGYGGGPGGTWGTGMQGAGGGGAGGYAGSGGGGSVGAANGNTGFGGAGGGGAGNTGGNGGGASGGGVNVFGQWSNGGGGISNGSGICSWTAGGGGGSGGSSGTCIGGNYGGGFGGWNSSVGSWGGAVRVMWGAGRSFPMTNTSLNYGGSTETYN